MSDEQTTVFNSNESVECFEAQWERVDPDGVKRVIPFLFPDFEGDLEDYIEKYVAPDLEEDFPVDSGAWTKNTYFQNSTFTVQVGAETAATSFPTSAKTSFNVAPMPKPKLNVLFFPTIASQFAHIAAIIDDDEVNVGTKLTLRTNVPVIQNARFFFGISERNYHSFYVVTKRPLSQQISNDWNVPKGAAICVLVDWRYFFIDRKCSDDFYSLSYIPGWAWEKLERSGITADDYYSQTEEKSEITNAVNDLRYRALVDGQSPTSKRRTGIQSDRIVFYDLFRTRFFTEDDWNDAINYSACNCAGKEDGSFELITTSKKTQLIDDIDKNRNSQYFKFDERYKIESDWCRTSLFGTTSSKVLERLDAVLANNGVRLYRGDGILPNPYESKPSPRFPARVLYQYYNAEEGASTRAQRKSPFIITSSLTDVGGSIVFEVKEGEKYVCFNGTLYNLSLEKVFNFYGTAYRINDEGEVYGFAEFDGTYCDSDGRVIEKRGDAWYYEDTETKVPTRDGEPIFYYTGTLYDASGAEIVDSGDNVYFFNQGKIYDNNGEFVTSYDNLYDGDKNILFSHVESLNEVTEVSSFTFDKANYFAAKIKFDGEKYLEDYPSHIKNEYSERNSSCYEPKYWTNGELVALLARDNEKRQESIESTQKQIDELLEGKSEESLGSEKKEKLAELRSEVEAITRSIEETLVEIAKLKAQDDKDPTPSENVGQDLSIIVNSEAKALARYPKENYYRAVPAYSGAYSWVNLIYDARLVNAKLESLLAIPDRYFIHFGNRSKSGVPILYDTDARAKRSQSFSLAAFNSNALNSDSGGGRVFTFTENKTSVSVAEPLALTYKTVITDEEPYVVRHYYTIVQGYNVFNAFYLQSASGKVADIDDCSETITIDDEKYAYDKAHDLTAVTTREGLLFSKDFYTVKNEEHESNRLPYDMTVNWRGVRVGYANEEDFYAYDYIFPTGAADEHSSRAANEANDGVCFRRLLFDKNCFSLAQKFESGVEFLRVDDSGNAISDGKGVYEWIKIDNNDDLDNYFRRVGLIGDGEYADRDYLVKKTFYVDSNGNIRNPDGSLYYKGYYSGKNVGPSQDYSIINADGEIQEERRDFFWSAVKQDWETLDDLIEQNGTTINGKPVTRPARDYSETVCTDAVRISYAEDLPPFSTTKVYPVGTNFPGELSASSSTDSENDSIENILALKNTDLRANEGVAVISLVKYGVANDSLSITDRHFWISNTRKYLAGQGIYLEGSVASADEEGNVGLDQEKGVIYDKREERSVCLNLEIAGNHADNGILVEKFNGKEGFANAQTSGGFVRLNQDGVGVKLGESANPETCVYYRISSLQPTYKAGDYITFAEETDSEGNKTRAVTINNNMRLLAGEGITIVYGNNNPNADLELTENQVLISADSQPQTEFEAGENIALEWGSGSNGGSILTISAFLSDADKKKLKGDKGDKGDQGEQGPPGPQGPQGEPGKNGVDGKDGADGKDGLPGQNGADGKNGEDGEDGRSVYVDNQIVGEFMAGEGIKIDLEGDGDGTAEATISWNPEIGDAIRNPHIGETFLAGSGGSSSEAVSDSIGEASGFVSGISRTLGKFLSADGAPAKVLTGASSDSVTYVSDVIADSFIKSVSTETSEIVSNVSAPTTQFVTDVTCDTIEYVSDVSLGLSDSASSGSVAVLVAVECSDGSIVETTKYITLNITKKTLNLNVQKSAIDLTVEKSPFALNAEKGSLTVQKETASFTSAELAGKDAVTSLTVQKQGYEAKVPVIKYEQANCAALPAGSEFLDQVGTPLPKEEGEGNNAN